MDRESFGLNGAESDSDWGSGPPLTLEDLESAARAPVLPWFVFEPILDPGQWRIISIEC